MDRETRQMRSTASKFETRESEEGFYIEGYFSVFNSTYELWPGATESVAPGAFANTLGGDIRALIDHETRLVLGRNKSGTLELREDSHGLWGRVKINPNDQDALNTHARVDRGDVSQASFGFDITDEESEVFEDGSVHWTIKGVKLYECSIVTFPAYAETNIEARTKDALDVKKRETEALKEKLKKKLKGEE